MKYIEHCEQSRRSEGFPAQLYCRNCGRGPCPFGIGEPAAVPLELTIPNRLHGAAINERGEAI